MSEDFERFWKCYPSRPGNPKLPAQQVWEKLEKAKALPPIEDMIFAVAAYYKHCVKIGSLKTEYVAHARTWLNQKRWEAWMPEMRAALEQPCAAVLPVGYEDAARALIAEIGAPAYMAWFGKVKWSNGGDVIRIQCQSAFDRQRIEANYVVALERLTGKHVEVSARASD